jgi:DNA-binding XRE family transcriptional regulator
MRQLSDKFSKIVEKHRKAKGFSKSTLAEKAGLHQTYIGLLERGERSPNLDTAKPEPRDWIWGSHAPTRAANRRPRGLVLCFRLRRMLRRF